MFKNKVKTQAIACAALYVYLNTEHKKRERRFWVKKWRQDRTRYEHIPLLRDLKENDPDDFKNYLRMDKSTFEYILNLVRPYISKQDTVMRKSIPAEERLVATLRFLATGRSYQDLKFSTCISAPSLCNIIPETCLAIHTALKDEYLKFPRNKEEWLNIAEKFNFPNCGGALDGKHIRITQPPSTGAQYYNYKGFYSIVLMALVNADHEFIFVDIGKNGRLSDGGVIEYTEFYQRLKSQRLNLPTNDETKNKLNFVFLGDEAFALGANFLRPYPQRDLTYEKRIFNYRLSRARNVSENAFGLITTRFRVLHTCINMTPEKVCYIVLAICTLHNCLIKRSSAYVTATTYDKDNSSMSDITPGDWRKEGTELQKLQQRSKRNVEIEAVQNRNNYMTYFNTDGKVPWQDHMLTKGVA